MRTQSTEVIMQRIRIIKETDINALHIYMTELLEEDLPVLVPHNKKPDKEKNKIFINNHNGNNGSAAFIMEHEDRIVGLLQLTKISRPTRDHVAFIGLNVHRKYRNKGIGRELLKNGLLWAKKDGNIERIELEVTEDNKQAISLYSSEGFEIEGRQRKAIKRDGNYKDFILMAKII